jgi:hypothetical protein
MKIKQGDKVLVRSLTTKQIRVAIYNKQLFSKLHRVLIDNKPYIVGFMTHIFVYPNTPKLKAMLEG